MKSKNGRKKYRNIDLKHLNYKEKDLSKLLNFDGDEETSLIDKCKYYEPNQVNGLSCEKHKLRILHINICGLIGKLNRLKNVLHTLNESKCFVDVLLICETHLNDYNVNCTNLNICLLYTSPSSRDS